MAVASPAPTPVGAPGWLAEVKARIALVAGGGPCQSDASCAAWHAAKDRIATIDAPALAAALEAVLALADEWDQRSAALAGEQPIAAEYQTCRAQTLSECANRARVAFESALRDAPTGRTSRTPRS